MRIHKVEINSDIIRDKSDINVTINVIDKTSNKKIDTDKLVLNLLKENPTKTREELANDIGKNIRTIQRALAKLSKEGKIKRIGSTRTGYWEVLM